MPTLDNYRLLLSESPEFFRGLGNSFIITIGVTLLALIASLCSGYVYARYRNRVFNASAVILLLIRMMPPIVVTVPLFPMANILALNDTHFILILLYASFYVTLGTFIMNAFISEIPVELEEAAAVDGAGLIMILLRVVFPLAVYGLVTLALFVIVFSWNEYVFGMIFTTRIAKTAPVVIGEMLGTVEGVQWGPIFAAATIQLLPIVALVIALQKFLIAGLTTGAVKS